MIRASDLQILRSDGNKEAIHAYNGNLFSLILFDGLLGALKRLTPYTTTTCT